MSLPSHPLTVTVNGTTHGPLQVPDGMPMIDVLHEMLGLTGSRLGCGVGLCHACVVIWDKDDHTSEEMPTCVTEAHFFDGKRIRTIEGIAKRSTKGEIIALSSVQQAFLDHFSFQCGYCTPGFVNAATVLVEQLMRAHPPRGRGGDRGCGTRKSYLPLQRLRALFRSGAGFDPDHPRTDTSCMKGGDARRSRSRRVQPRISSKSPRLRLKTYRRLLVLASSWPTDRTRSRGRCRQATMSSRGT